jgi:hypothetical protein
VNPERQQTEKITLSACLQERRDMADENILTSDPNEKFELVELLGEG